MFVSRRSDGWPLTSGVTTRIPAWLADIRRVCSRAVDIAWQRHPQPMTPLYLPPVQVHRAKIWGFCSGGTGLKWRRTRDSSSDKNQPARLRCDFTFYRSSFNDVNTVEPSRNKSNLLLKYNKFIVLILCVTKGSVGHLGRAESHRLSTIIPHLMPLS
jgi:hypothetical protein